MAVNNFNHRDDDGHFYANENRVMRAPIVRFSTDPVIGDFTGLTMAWFVASAITEEAATAIAEALNLKYADEIAATREKIDAKLAEARPPFSEEV